MLAVVNCVKNVARMLTLTTVSSPQQRSHASVLSAQKFSMKNATAILQPPYRPDFSPSDFFSCSWNWEL